MRLLLPIFLLACAQDPASPEAATRAAPPPALSFEASPLWIGREVTFTVAGPPAGAAVRVYASFTPGAARTCPPELGGACLGIGRARLIAEGVAPRTGPTVLRATLPTATPLDAVAVQAAVTRGAQTGLSPVVRTRTVDPARTDTDGDGLMDGPELDRGTDPLDADTDADLLQDGDEVRYGADPTNADTDGDGVFDGAEVRLHATDPRLADTDGDGVSDGFELAIGLNPLVPDPGDPTGPGTGPTGPFRDSDGDGVPDYLDAETCDGRDNDGDGAIDEGFDADDSDHDGVRDCLEIEDCDCVDDDGDGQIAEHCQFALNGVLAADDSFQAWLDDQPLATGAGFNTPTSFVAPVMGGVRHVNVEAWDVGSNYVGFLGRVGFNGSYTNTTGVPGPWTTRSTAPPAGWLTNPTGFFTPFEVRDCGWNGGPTALRSAGADWIWPEVIPAGATAGCATVPGYDPYGVPTRAWFTTELLVCGENLEVCDGLDNNANGQVDEGLADSDGDGLCDAREYEVCNGVDDDGDGEVDEGLPDADGDGVCNAVDMETCDGFDNDGDWLIDESPDADYDGVSDCGVDACAIPDTSLFLFSSGSVARLDLTTATLTPLAVGQTPNAARDAVFAPGGQVLAAVGAREVWRMSSTGVPSQLLHTMPVPANPNLAGIATITVDETGRVYTTNRDHVAWWDPSTNQDGTFGLLPGAQFNGIAWHDGHLYLASDLGSGTHIYEANPISGLLTLITTVAVDDVQFLAITHSGTAWTIDGARRVVSFPITGGPVSILTTLQNTWNGGALRGGWCEAGIEVCNGVDDDGDGQIDDDLDDEDADADGVCDALDTEICDGVDNDGDAQIDEGTPDTDGDGLCDLIDAEQCDGLDNDGDGVVDDGMLDNDTDGVCNALDVEACDGLDNDGDGALDEGFDRDLDGLPDCSEAPCDRLDLRYYAIEGGDELVRTDPQTGAELSRLPLGMQVADLAMHPDGRLFAVGQDNIPSMGMRSIVAELDPITGQHTVLADWPEGMFFYGATWDDAGHLWVSGPAALLRMTEGDWSAHAVAPLGLYDLAWHQGTLVGAVAFSTTTSLSTINTTDGTLTPLATVALPEGGVASIGGRLFVLGRSGGLVEVGYGARDTVPRYQAGALAFAAPPCPDPIELCNGADDNGDGAIDEGFDADTDQIPDCVDFEACDGLDNDGDGVVDNGYDGDNDGLADCFDPCPAVRGASQLLYASYNGTLGTWDPRLGLGTTLGTTVRPLGDVARLTDGRLAAILVDGVGATVEPHSGALTLQVRNYNSANAGAAGPGGELWVTTAGWDLSDRTVTRTSAVIDVVATQAMVIQGNDVYQARRVTSTTSTLSVRDLTTGATSASWPIPFSVNGLATVDGDWFFAEGSRIHRLDLATGATTLVHDTGVPSLVGLTSWPSGCPIDAELCDGVDNDGDGLIDEGVADTDADGLCDTLDVEVCDGVDNDGDGDVDEGIDIDADGVPDCQEDPCEVDDPRIFLSTTPNTFGFGIPVDSRVDAMNVDTGAVVTLAQGSVYFTDIAVHPDGRLFGSDGGANVYEVPLNGQPGFAGQITDPAHLGPMAIGGPALTFDAAGHLLLANGADLWTIDADTLQVIAHVANAQGISASGDLAFVDGDLYLSGFVPLVGSGLYRVNRTTGALTLTLPLATSLWGVDTLLDGTLVGGMLGAVQRIDPLTGLSTPVGTLPSGRMVWGAASPVSWCNARQELCNGVDDDDDGLIDEGAPDSDGDGLCDSYDAEACDHLDNDGDGAVDEGFDSDGDGLPDCSDFEACDGLDNDGDGAVDEGFDSNLDGIADCFGPDLCNCLDDDYDGQLDEDCSYNLSMIATGVGTWSVWLDGAPWMSGNYTAGPSSVSATVSGGVHPIAAKIDVDSLSLPGWLADVYVDGASVAPTASGRWTVSTSAPPPGWQTSSLGAMERLAFGASYPTQPGFAASTAQWVWSDWPDPARFSGNWYTLDLLVCGPPGLGTREVCDGLDNDNDGVVDNGFGDADSNGVADCFEPESVCDGVDNDGDGFADEGFADSDLDGVPDCAEALEPCDGRDNNGDGVIDEGCCDPNDTEVYAAVYDGVDMVLTVLDPGALTETPIGPMLDTVFDLTFTPSGDLYGIGADGDLYRVDPTSGATMPLGQVLSGGQPITTLGLASDVSGHLWALSADAVWSLDVASLTATRIITLSAGALLDAGDLAGLGGRLYVTGLEAATGEWAVVEVDTNTGVITSRVTMGPEAAGLTATPGGLLFTGMGDLLVETDPVTSLRTAVLQASGDIRGLAARGVVCGGLRQPAGVPIVRQ